MLRKSLLLASSAVLFAACSAAPTEEVDSSEDELRTSYADIMETLDETTLEKWISVRSYLEQGFDNICGDTICSGDFSNLETVKLKCSSTRATQKLKDCVWVLGGNIDYVDGRTGKITTDARAFTCHIPVNSSAKQMVETLVAAEHDALDTPLPGTDKSFYDGLVECFDGVGGGPPPNVPQNFYVSLEDYQWEQGDAVGLAWQQTKRDLATAFDEICGDSFCEGEYPDISALRFTCAVNRNTKKISRCAWSFAAADLQVGSRGQIKANTTTKRCYVNVNATVADFTSAIATDPLNAPLPGKTTSIYDALIGCL